jgi:hypothetical protein
LKTISSASEEEHVGDDESVASVDSTEDDSDSDEEDEEFNEFLAERRMILADARKLQTLADFYLSPEKPVVSDGFSSARSYFSRYSAPEQTSMEMEDERDMALKEALNLKKLAVDYYCPEKPVEVTDAAACGRNYFDRPSAVRPEQVDEEEYQQILKDMKQLKVTAEWYLQPEKPVEYDGFCTGRNFFNRPSAPQFEEDEDIEREQVLNDMKQLKTCAEWYLQPEKPVIVDATCFGRNYYSRPSAPEYIDEDELEEQDQIIYELKQLKTTAEWYLQPEKPVITSDPTACGRNYYTRASAPEDEDEDDMEECIKILEEAAKLKQVAEWYMHPEAPVKCEDACAFGRNYFNRASAPTNEEELERQQVLADAAELKKVAGWYMHPEAPVECDDSCATARNYFNRASAPTNEEELERQQVLAEAAELKKVAGWYMHPEEPVVCNDPCAAARNYFSRPSAPEYEDEDDMDECDRILAETLEMKKMADWYLHPEKPVETDGFAFARNYFTRASAPTNEDEEDLDEDERQLVLLEAKNFKTVAEWYHCPEKPVETDGFASGRNYFNRPSAPEQDTDSAEIESILADARALKQVAEWYHCPEKPVEVDATATSRCYFSRPSAPWYEDAEAMEEREVVLAEASRLKQVAEWYHHPETPVTSSIAVTRNYFTRPSAEDQQSMEEEQERAQVLADAMQLKKLAVDYLHPEMPVDSSINCARNYFDRATAPGHADHIHTEGHAIGQQGYLEIHHFDDHDVHHHNDYYHHDDYYGHHADDHSMQSDHFEMEEDQFHCFRESMVAYHKEHVEHVPIIREGNEKEGGHLSRSPSDVMLFDESAM